MVDPDIFRADAGQKRIRLLLTEFQHPAGELRAERHWVGAEHYWAGAKSRRDSLLDAFFVYPENEN